MRARRDHLPDPAPEPPAQQEDWGPSAERDRSAPVVTARARVDRRTKNLVKRLQPGEIAVIDHVDLDRVAAETLIEARASAVVNAAESMSGRYPNVGPLLVAAAGIPLLDGVGPDVMAAIAEGDVVTVDGDQVVLDGHVIAKGTRHSLASLEERIAEARASMGVELARFAENTLEYLQRESHLLTDEPDVPDVGVDFRDRQALVVVRGADYREDLDILRQVGWIRDIRPVAIGVDGGADALLAIGVRPDVIIGDMDSVTEAALRCGAALVVHAYPGGKAPGAARLDALGLPYRTFESAGTSEDIAMLLAYEKGAELIVAVGTHNSMVEFLDKGRAGMASTFLVRMRVGPVLVDAKGVSRLYQGGVRGRHLVFLVLSAIFTFAVVLWVSEPIRLLVRTLWVDLTAR
ncbi:MAG TPA: putative cytokinetic ring protein SteA [Acidimicrobiales bacterium]|jgi:uncharacterized membrane-anchored protein